MNAADHEKIFKPLLEITYEEIPVSMISTNTKAELKF
jgi:hypothetical protein